MVDCLQFGAIDINGRRRSCRALSLLMQGLGFGDADGETKEAGILSEPLCNGLEVRLRVCHKNTVLGKESLLEQLLCCLGRGTQSPKVEQGVVQPVPQVHPTIKVAQGVSQDVGKGEDKQDWSEHTALLHVV